MNNLSRLTLSALVLSLALAGYGASGGSNGGTASAARVGATLHEENCEGLSASIVVDADNVDPFVPPPFTVAVGPDIRDADGDGDRLEQMATLILTAERCKEQSIGNTVFPEGKVFAHLSAFICDPEPATTDELFNNYHLFAATTNPDEAKFYHEQGGLTDRQFVRVNDLAIDLDRDLGTFTFEARPPTPSPFKIVARVDEPITPVPNFRQYFWASVPSGIMRLTDDANGIRTGLASYRVDPAEGSDMEKMFGGGEIKVTNEPFTSVEFDSASFTAEVLDEATFGPGPFPGQDDCQPD